MAAHLADGMNRPGIFLIKKDNNVRVRIHMRKRQNIFFVAHRQTRFGRTPISSAVVSPCSVRSDPQQKSAVLGRIPRRRFLLSAHSISAIPPATMVAERNRRLYKWRDLSQMNAQG